MTKEELVVFLIENFTDEEGWVDLSGLDFGERGVDLGYIKANVIQNIGQEAMAITNHKQRALIIENFEQETGVNTLHD